MEDKLTRNRTAEYLLFFLVSYGVNFLFGISLITHPDLKIEVFEGLIVLLPATAVFLIKYLYKEEENASKILRNVMFGLCLFHIAIIILKVVGILNDNAIYWITSIAAGIGSIILLVGRKAGKDSKAIFTHIDAVNNLIFLLVFLLIMRNIVSSISSVSLVLGSINSTFMAIITIPIAFLLTAVNYFGEEYGWRGYLQEIMQNKFGKRLGVILLGVVWEIWHIPFWFTKYELQIWELPFRFAMTISMAIFLGYIYMKTRNVWLCSLVHCIYNTLSGGPGHVIQAATSVIPLIAQSFVTIILSLFIFAKEYSGNYKESYHCVN